MVFLSQTTRLIKIVSFGYRMGLLNKSRTNGIGSRFEGIFLERIRNKSRKIKALDITENNSIICGKWGSI
jgi:hypothetical protein